MVVLWWVLNHNLFFLFFMARSKGSRRLLNGEQLREQEQRVEQEIRRQIDDWKRFSFARNCEMLKMSEEIMKANTLALPKYEIYYTMECTLTDKQITSLLPIMNKYITLESITTGTLKACLCDTLEQPIKIKDVGVLGYLLAKLKKQGIIVSDWQKVAEKSKLFVSRNGVPLSGKKISNMTAQKVLVVENIRVGRRGYKRGMPKYDKIIEPIEVIDNWILSL